MNKQTKTEVAKALICASGLMPTWDDDYYENCNGQGYGRLQEGISQYFNHDVREWFCSWLTSMDTPSETIKIIVDNWDYLRNEEQ